jgi:lysozyme family protein
LYLDKVENTVKSVTKKIFVAIGSDLNARTRVVQKCQPHTATTPRTWRALGQHSKARVNELSRDVEDLLKENIMKDTNTFYLQKLHDTSHNNLNNLNYANNHFHVIEKSAKRVANVTIFILR